MSRVSDAGRAYIAGEVRAELARQGVSVTSLAKRVGMSKEALSARTRGARPFRAEELAAIAAALGKPVTQFTPRPREPEPVP